MADLGLREMSHEGLVMGLIFGKWEQAWTCRLGSGNGLKNGIKNGTRPNRITKDRNKITIIILIINNANN